MYHIFDPVYDSDIVRTAYLIRLIVCSEELAGLDTEILLMMERNTRDILNTSERVRTIPYRVRNIIKDHIHTS
jgi:hypothetical protein